MPNELTVTLSLAFAKNSSSESFNPFAPLATALFNIAGSKYVKHRQTIGFASPEAIELGEVPAGGAWIVGINRDATNIIRLIGTTGEAPFAEAAPGEAFLFKFAAAVTAPEAQALIADCAMEYFIVEA